MFKEPGSRDVYGEVMDMTAEEDLASTPVSPSSDFS